MPLIFRLAPALWEDFEGMRFRMYVVWKIKGVRRQDRDQYLWEGSKKNTSGWELAAVDE